MEEAIYRLKLAADAGADVCFIEGVRTKELLESTVVALAPKPVRLSSVCVEFSSEHVSGSCECYLRWSYPFIHYEGSRRDGCEDYQ